MKKLLALVLALMVCGLCACSASAEHALVMTSFYPIHILAMNVFADIDHIQLECMTAPQTGCLHDYQLMVSDMMKLSKADALIVCGAGMENYLNDAKGQFSDLHVIDCSQGIDLIADDHGHYNAHTWLDVQNALQIVRTISEQAVSLFPSDADKIRSNTTNYIAKLEELDKQLKHMLSPLAGNSIVTFHEAFPYFAHAYGLEIAAVIAEDHDDALSPFAIANVIESVKDAGVPPLFTEPQYSSAAAQTIAAETGAKLYTLDPLVSGDISTAAYEIGMLANAQALLDAFANND